MAVYAVNGTLHEVLINAGIVQFLDFEHQLVLKVMRLAFFVFQQIADACMQHGQVERFTDKGIRPHFISFGTVFLLVLGCQKNHGNMTEFQLVLHTPAKLDAVHYGHHHVRNNQVNILIVKHSHSLLTVFGRMDIVFTFQQPDH